MAPRTEFVVLSTALALLLAVVAYVAAAHGSQVGQWGEGAWRALTFAVPSAVSSALAAWLTLGWQRRALARQKRWSAVGLNWRTVLLAFLLFPMMMTAWMVFTTLYDHFTAASPGALSDNLAWLPIAALILSAIAVVAGAIPAFIIEFFVCRRYLRRTAVVTTGSA